MYMVSMKQVTAQAFLLEALPGCHSRVKNLGRILVVIQDFGGIYLSFMHLSLWGLPFFFGSTSMCGEFISGLGPLIGRRIPHEHINKSVISMY